VGAGAQTYKVFKNLIGLADNDNEKGSKNQRRKETRTRRSEYILYMYSIPVISSTIPRPPVDRNLQITTAEGRSGIKTRCRKK
jgi:hypothetical protein